MNLNWATGRLWFPRKAKVVLLGTLLGVLALNFPPFETVLFALATEVGTISVENNRFVVELMGPGEPRFDPNTGGRVKFTFNVNDKSVGRKYSITLDNITSEIRNIRFSRDRLIVFGIEATHHSPVTTILNAVNGAEIDSIMGFDFSLSESGASLAYRKFYPPQGSAPPRQSDLVLVYDLSDSPAGNRLRDLAIYLGDPAGRLIEVGRPIYPEKNIGKTNYRVWVRAKNRRHSIAPEGIFWLERDRGVAFIDRVSGENNLVLVDLSAGLDRPMIYKKWINVLTLMRMEDVGDAVLVREAKQLRLKGVHEFENGLIAFRISSGTDLAINELELSMDDFLTGKSYEELHPSKPMEEDEHPESDHH